MAEVVDLPSRSRVRRFVPTSTTASVERVLNYCSRQRVLGLVVGVPGVGKSAAARAYVEDNLDAVLVTMGTRHDSVMAALGQILEALAGDLPPARAASDLHRQLVKFLRYGADAKRFVLESLEDGAGPSLLVIDEAHAMPQAAAEAIRDLAEEARVGVAFVANLDLYQKWFPDKAGRRIASEQFVSRIVPRLVLVSVPSEDLRAILAARGISAAAELAFLARIAGSTGRLRAVDNVLNMAAADGLALTLPHLKRAAGMCGHDV